MKKTLLLLALPAILAACTSTQPVSQNAEWNELKARCNAQDFAACADIAHAVKRSENFPGT